MWCNTLLLSGRVSSSRQRDQAHRADLEILPEVHILFVPLVLLTFVFVVSWILLATRKVALPHLGHDKHGRVCARL